MVLMQLLVGCGDDVPIATSTDVEHNMTAYLRSQAARPIESVDCPDGKRLDDGDKIDCFATLPDGTSIPLRITVQGRQGRISYYPGLRR